MPKATINELAAFMAVARERSFTRAAAQLGVSTSALSHSIRGLEERLGLRLLSRTTRQVVPTGAGERLLNSVGPHLTSIDAELDALSALRDKPAGTVRITSTEHAAVSILMPAVAKLLPRFPDISVEIITDVGLTDIVAERFDAGVRPGDIIAKDMIAVPIGPPLRMAVAGSPAYFRDREMLRKPQDLIQHKCINLRLPTHGGIYVWEFERRNKELRVRVEGQLVFNNPRLMLEAAAAGHGLVFVTEGQLQPYIQAGSLVRVLEDWCDPFPGYYLYYPSRRQPTPAFSLLLDALRFRG
jgi:DNA-binding transcriptional LysR family regulator